MGNYVSRQTSASSAGKVVLSDGSVHAFDHPTSVAELMLDHPQEFVVELQSLVVAGRSNKKPTPLPADHRLDQAKVYLMLPMRRGKAATLSDDEVKAVLTRTRSLLRSGSFPSSSWSLMGCAGDLGKGKEVDVVKGGDRLVVEKPEKDEFPVELMEGRPEFLSRQFSSKGWKPSLDPIEEKRMEKKVQHWLF